MNRRLPKERIIYSNYDLVANYPDEDMIESLIENGTEREDITDEDIWEERYFYNEIDWEDAKELLSKYFNKCIELVCEGSVGRWNGVVSGKFYFNTLDELLSTAGRDCDYFKFYDCNGHLYMHCSHHDGSCKFEIKEITDKRNPRLLRIAEKEWGCPAREYVPMTKENIINHLNKNARSFYC